MGVFIQPPFWALTRGREPMRASGVLVTAPAQVLTLADAKLHTRIDPSVTVEDTAITNWIKAATTQVENDTGIKLLTQTWDLVANRFPAEDWLTLPWGPLQSVTS